MTRLRTIALLAAVAAAGCFGWPKPNPADQADDPPAQEQLKPDFVTTAEALADEILTDPGDASVKYLGKVVEFEGRVLYANKIKTPLAIPLMSVKSPGTGKTLDVNCLTVRDLDKLWGLGHGQRVKVVGRPSVVPGHLMMDDCTITPLEPCPTRTVRSRQLCADFVRDEKAVKQNHFPPGQQHTELIVEGAVAALTTKVVGDHLTLYFVELEGAGPYRVSALIPEADWRRLRKASPVAIKCDCERHDFPDFEKTAHLRSAFVLHFDVELKDDKVDFQPPARPRES
jgi:hypothetical protein